jgi:hypothetical protein
VKAEITIIWVEKGQVYGIGNKQWGKCRAEVNEICEQKAFEERKACSSKYTKPSGENKRRKAGGKR